MQASNCRFLGILTYTCCIVTALAIWPASAQAIYFVTSFEADSIGGLESNGPMPAGAAKLASDPLRGTGWQGIFSECPNDVIHFGYELKTSVDLQHLVDQLVKIETPEHVIYLEPGDAPQSMFLPKRKNGAGYSVIFSIGNQQILNQWYANLAVDVEPDGKRVRKFGQWRYESCPDAQPPTLTIYTGDAAFDVNDVRFAVAVELKSGISDWHRKQPELAPAIKQIEKLIADHEAARKKDADK